MSKRLKTSEEEKVVDPDDVFIGLDDVIHDVLVPFLSTEDRVKFLCGVNKRLRAAFGYSHVIGSKNAPVTPWIAFSEADDYRAFADFRFLRFLVRRRIPGYRMHIKLRPYIMQHVDFAGKEPVYLLKGQVEQFMRIESLDIKYIEELAYMELAPQYLMKDVSAVYVRSVTMDWPDGVRVLPLPSEARKDRYAPIRSIRFKFLSTEYSLEIVALEFLDSVLHSDASITIEKYEVNNLPGTATLLDRIQEVESLQITDLQEGNIYPRPSFMMEYRERVQYLQPAMAPIVSLMKKARAIVCKTFSLPWYRRALDPLLQFFAMSAGPKRHTALSASIVAADPPLSALAASQCTAVTLLVRYASEYKAKILDTLRGLVHFTNMTRLVAQLYPSAPIQLPSEYQVSVPEAAKMIIGGRIQLQHITGRITLEIDWPAPPDAPALHVLAREIYRLSLWMYPQHFLAYGQLFGEKATEMAAAEFE